MSEPIKAWCLDKPTGTTVIIGRRADAESRAEVMTAGGQTKLMISGPYDFELVTPIYFGVDVGGQDVAVSILMCPHGKLADSCAHCADIEDRLEEAAG